jgi:ferredoxin
LIINDVAMEAKVGERLLNVARRNAAHIGFMCDNAGTCQGCRCQVLAGADQLSPPSAAEQAWIPAERLATGERLACQAIIHGQGEVRMLSRAEELRRMVMGIIAPRAGESRLNPLSPLVKILAQTSADQVSRFPRNVWSALRHIGPRRFAFPVLDRERVFRDGARVVQQLRSTPATTVRPLSQSVPITITADLPAAQCVDVWIEPQAE